MVASGATFYEYKQLVMNAKFVCRICGRVAANADNLCDPNSL